MNSAQQQYQDTVELYRDRANGLDDNWIGSVLTVAADLESELRRTEQDTFLLAFGFCLYSSHGPTDKWSENLDDPASASPTEVAIALAQSALVNDLLNES